MDRSVNLFLGAPSPARYRALGREDVANEIELWLADEVASRKRYVSTLPHPEGVEQILATRYGGGAPTEVEKLFGRTGVALAPSGFPGTTVGSSRVEAWQDHDRGVIAKVWRWISVELPNGRRVETWTCGGMIGFRGAGPDATPDGYRKVIPLPPPLVTAIAAIEAALVARESALVKADSRWRDANDRKDFPWYEPGMMMRPLDASDPEPWEDFSGVPVPRCTEPFTRKRAIHDHCGRVIAAVPFRPALRVVRPECPTDDAVTTARDAVTSAFAIRWARKAA